MAISAIHFLRDRIVGDLLTHQNAADLTPPRSPQTLAREQRKHCKCRNSNLRRLQCLRVNTLLQGAWRDAYKALALLKKIFPTAWQHIYFHSHYTFCGRKIPIDLDAMLANLALEEDEERLPQIVDSIRLDPEMLSGIA
jgi:hypothetical protein